MSSLWKLDKGENSFSSRASEKEPSHRDSLILAQGILCQGSSDVQSREIKRVLHFAAEHVVAAIEISARGCAFLFATGSVAGLLF